MFSDITLIGTASRKKSALKTHDNLESLFHNTFNLTCSGKFGKQ